MEMTQEEVIVWHEYPKEKPKGNNQIGNYPSYLIEIDSVVTISEYNLSEGKWQHLEKYVTAWAEMPRGFGELRQKEE